MATDYAKRALYGPARVGGDTLSYCTKCKMELAHVIVSMIDTRPAKVICKTCRSQHNYRSGEPVAAKPRAGSTLAARAPKQPASVVRVAELWQKRLAESNASTTKPYQVSSSYLKGDVIQHGKFGMGIVEDVKSNGKMTVLFRDGERVLVHAMPAANAS